MGYAKQLGKQYNAESAWSSLGSPKGWQEYYDIASQAPKYERLYQQLSNVKLPARTYDWGFDVNNTRTSLDGNIVNPQALVAGLFSNINSYPIQVLENGLAGRYVNFL